MSAYLINILLLTLSGAYLFGYQSGKQGRKLFVVFAVLSWVVISGLRHDSIGADTLAYRYSFDRVANVSWAELWGRFVNIIFLGEPGKDPGYSLIEKLIHTLLPDYQVFLFLIALIFTVPLGIWVYRYSRDPYISILLYSTLFYSFFAITGQRQTLATASVVFLGYELIRKRKLIPFLALVLISSTVHRSALVFLPFYFIANIRINRGYLLFVLAGFILLFIFRVPVALFFQDVSGYDYGVYDRAGTTNFTIVLLLVFIVALLQYRHVITRNPNAIHYYNALVAALLLTPLTWVNPSAMRAVQYYSIFLMLLIPELIWSFLPKDRRVVYIVVVSLLLILFLRSNTQFRFFWS